MIDWAKMIERDKNAVIDFARGADTTNSFQRAFSGTKNPARSVLRQHGSLYGRRLARKALRRRNIKV